ncbi:hypothetical protein [Anaerosacchariphilus polymeriproducens]|uniref:Uncharacterized protein n=1 Tax=Anaerosacchariphilus polymeriproducens TaxID=1812858 RepID=A0A371ARY0_9FIRM|nr:hypothetical protein [Anaerosacchariphilus polymeriproducens]RDU22325.1 hypothetical protein DWV06_13590 [Anaerosacchariphilus polymeriproducens]
MSSKTSGNETKIDKESYLLIVNEIESAAEELLAEIINDKIKSPGTQTVQKYIEAHKHMIQIIKKYKMHMKKVVSVMEKSEARIRKIDEEASVAAANVE